MKPYFGKEWLLKKLAAYFKETEIIMSNELQKQQSRCLVLLGETGTGKSHLCSEMKWPTSKQPIVDANSILGVYFFR